MALNLGIGGSKQSQTSQSQTTQNEQQIGSQSQQGSGVTTTLDPQTIATLQGIIQTLAPNVGQSADAALIRNLSTQLSSNLDPNLVTANIKAAQDVAIKNFNQNQGAAISNLAQQVGSTGNSFVVNAQTQGNLDLASILAEIDTRTRLGAAGQRSADLSGAISGIGAASQVQQQPMQQLLQAVAALSGARTEQSNTQQSLSNLISNLTSKTNATGTSKSFGFNAGLTGS